MLKSGRCSPLNLRNLRRTSVASLRAWVVRVEGVGFFDIFHQQIGVAENCMELHPLLKIEFVRQLSPEFPLPRRIDPPTHHQCGRLDRDGRFADEEWTTYDFLKRTT